MSDSGYGHDDISCMTYDIHVDILLGCVFVVRPLHVHLDGEELLQKSFSTGLYFVFFFILYYIRVEPKHVYLFVV